MTKIIRVEMPEVTYNALVEWAVYNYRPLNSEVLFILETELIRRHTEKETKSPSGEEKTDENE